ncbi:hypothetical protein G3N28_23290, partial [Desulfobacter hydrogenophilus]|uniref:hypothetical protein n=1 Tax=Desulfobacter hydrogenophilus TaxID=2291 RepID=UPI0013FAA2C3
MSVLISAASATLPELERMMRRLAPVRLVMDVHLSPGDHKALGKLVEAARVIDDIFLQQLWSGNEVLLAKLKADHSPLGKARLHYFWINKGPWSDLDGH